MPRAGQARPRILEQLTRIAGLLVLCLLLGGCVEKADGAATQRQAFAPAGDLYGRHTVGQTFVPSRDGLDRVEVLLVDYGAESGRSSAPLELFLCRDPTCDDVVTRTVVPPEEIAHNRSFSLRCPPQPDSAGRAYTLLAAAPQAPDPARVTLWAHPADYYPDGFLLIDGRPAPGDLNFWTFYQVDAARLSRDLLAQAAAGLGQLPALLLLFLAPGYLLARLLPRSRHEDILDILGTCLALSVAVVPVFLLLLSLLGPLLSGPAVRWGGGLLALLTLALLAWDLRRGSWRGLSRISWPAGLAFLGIVGIGLTLRAVHALDLGGPMWVDAVHHATLARLIVERQAIPGDYRPYAEVAPATYHFGFQSMVALLHQLSGASWPSALLLLGQALSGLTALPLYTLGKRWGGSRWAGLCAAAIPSALSLLPAYYVSWSRYTELAGLLLLPVAAGLLERWLLQRRRHWGLGAATAVALAGSLVTHLRVAAFLLILGLLLLLQATWEWRYRRIAEPWARALLAGLAAALLTWPWLGPTLLHLALPAAQAWPLVEETLSLYYPLFGPGRAVTPLIAAGAILGLPWRRHRTLLLAAWVALMVVLANPGLVGLQAGGPIDLLTGWHLGGIVDDTAVAIALYVPLSLAAALAGGGLARLVRWGGRRLLGRAAGEGERRAPWWGRGWRWAAAAILLAACAWGAHDLRQVVNPSTALLAPADEHAIAWIAENTAPGDQFLINAYEWLPHVYAGMDGGYWITPLAGRPTWPPPALYGLGTAEYIRRVNDLLAPAMASAGGEELLPLLQRSGIDYVYLGRYGGPLQPEKLLANPGFRLVYQQEGVWIWAVVK